ncbi:MAG: sensor histidine kinase [bacterium]|nr:sensor histidine kinase [bacterium]
MNKWYSKYGRYYILLFFFVVLLLQSPSILRGDTSTIEKLLELAEQKKNNDAKAARQHCLEAQKLLVHIPTKEREHFRLEVRSHNLLAWACRNLGNNREGLAYCKKGLALAKRINDREGMAFAYKNMVLLNSMLNRYPEALEYSDKALALFRQLGQRKQVAWVLNNMGHVYYSKDNIGKSLEAFLEAAEIFEAIKFDKGICAIKNNIGLIYTDTKQYPKALQFFKRALQVLEKTPEDRNKMSLYNNIGIVYFHLEKFDKAVESYHLSMALAEKIGSDADKSTALTNLAELYGERKMYPEALGNARRALAIHEKYSNKRGITSALQAIGYIYFKTGKTSKAVQCFNRALKVGKGINEIDQTLTIYLGLSECYSRMNKHKEALEYFRQYKKESDRMYNRDSTLKITEMQIKYESERKEKKIQLLEKNREINALDEARKQNTLSLMVVITLLLLLLLVLVHNRHRANDRIKHETLKRKQVESMGLLAGGMAHDFNNLLCLLLTNLSLLQLTIGGKDTRGDKLLDKMENNMTQAADLAKKLVTFSKGEMPVRTQLSLDLLVRRVSKELPELKERPFDVSLPEEPPVLDADEKQITEVLTNILKNAMEADPHNRPITLGAEKVTVDGDRNAFYLKAGEYVKIGITDQGRGIPAEQMADIFTPYFSTKTDYNQKGLGLGLSICYFILKKHDGHIAVSSQEGEGTTVTIYVPASCPQESDEARNHEA